MVDEAAEHSAASTMSRRRLLQGAAFGAVLVGGVATRSLASSPPSIDGPAGVEAVGQRLTAHQVAPTLPPPPRPWEPGWFITNVVVDDGRRMALTFDDGPSPYNTYPILRTLAEHGIKATFYLVGTQVYAYESVAKAIVDEGHEVGNHSVYHTPYRASALASQIGPNQEIIHGATGVRPVTHRAPGLTEGQVILSTCQAHGLYEAHTHMSTFDYLSPRYSAWNLYLQFIRHHRNGAFPIYHDGGGRRPTPGAIPLIVEYGKSIGYRFSTVTELVESEKPAPGWMSYSDRLVERAEGAGFPETAETVMPTCNYDARASFEARLDDPTVGRAERSRIVEVLAEMDALAADT